MNWSVILIDISTKTETDDQLLSGRKQWTNWLAWIKTIYKPLLSFSDSKSFKPEKRNLHQIELPSNELFYRIIESFKLVSKVNKYPNWKNSDQIHQNFTRYSALSRRIFVCPRIPMEIDGTSLFNIALCGFWVQWLVIQLFKWMWDIIIVTLQCELSLFDYNYSNVQ